MKLEIAMLFYCPRGWLFVKRLEWSLFKLRLNLRWLYFQNWRLRRQKDRLERDLEKRRLT